MKQIILIIFSIAGLLMENILLVYNRITNPPAKILLYVIPIELLMFVICWVLF